MSQTGRYRCNNPACGQPPRGLEFEGRDGQCPRCGRQHRPGHAASGVVELCDVHFQVYHSAGAQDGWAGRFYVACEPKRDCLAPNPFLHYAASDDPRAVTCPACLRTKEWREMCRALFPAHFNLVTGGDRPPAQVLVQPSGEGCCG